MTTLAHFCQQLSDSNLVIHSKILLFFVENKRTIRLKIFFYLMRGNKLKSLTSNNTNKSNTTILAKKGLVKDKKITSIQWSNYNF